MSKPERKPARPKKDFSPCALVDVQVNLAQCKYDTRDVCWYVYLKPHVDSRGFVRVREERSLMLTVLNVYRGIEAGQIVGDKAREVEAAASVNIPILFRQNAEVEVVRSKENPRYKTMVLRDPKPDAEVEGLVTATKVKTGKTNDYFLKEAQWVFKEQRRHTGTDGIINHLLVSLTSQEAPLTILERFMDSGGKKMGVRITHLSSLRSVIEQEHKLINEHVLEGSAIDHLWMEDQDKEEPIPV